MSETVLHVMTVLKRETRELADALADSQRDRAQMADQLATAQEEARRLREALVANVLPYVALLMDSGSRRWIAPELWQSIETAVKTTRDALARGEAGDAK